MNEKKSGRGEILPVVVEEPVVADFAVVLEVAK